MRKLCTLEVTKCPHCGGCVLHRHGVTRAGEQRYRCKHCRRTCTRFSNRIGSHIRKRFAFERYLELLHRARSVRKDAEELGVAPSTVWRWRHQVIRGLSKRRNQQRLAWKGEAVATVHFIGRRRRYWGTTHELDWSIRRGYRREWWSEHGRGVPGTLVHFIIEAGGNLPGNISIEIGEGSVLHPCVPRTFVTRTQSRPNYWEYRGSRLFPVSYQNAPDDMLELARRPKMSPSRLWAMRYQKETTAPLASLTMRKAADTAIELRRLFLCWSARFRGISLGYLDRYIAWFIEKLKSRQLEIPRWLYPNLAS